MNKQKISKCTSQAIFSPLRPSISFLHFFKWYTKFWFVFLESKSWIRAGSYHLGFAPEQEDVVVAVSFRCGSGGSGIIQLFTCNQDIMMPSKVHMFQHYKKT